MKKGKTVISTRGTFLILVVIPFKEQSGIYKKILIQIRTMSSFGIDIQPKEIPSKTGLTYRVISRLPFFDGSLLGDDIFEGQDFLYMRRPVYLSRSFIRSLKRQRARNPKLKILYEIPTYPYDQELHALTMSRKLKDAIYILKDRHNRKLLPKCVDRIVTFSLDDKIFGVPTIRTINGADFDAVRPRHIGAPDDAIRLISVSINEPWHGYDRLIAGIGEYYRRGGGRNVVYHCVGDGSALQSYKDLAARYELENHVVFYGNQNGEMLDDIYDRADIGVDSLGRHRSGVSRNSSLKTREYAAKGLPMVVAMEMDMLKNKPQYFLRFPSDDTPVDIERIIDFYDALYAGGCFAQIAADIRESARRECDISVTMKPVIDYILDEKN